MNEDPIRTYDGILQVHPAKAARLGDSAQWLHLLDIYTDFIEVRYEGRDTNRHVLTDLKRIAELIEDATGEVICTYRNEEDPRFEFYTIEGGKLYVQKGHVQREPLKSECA
jgi:hypothetical protein